MHGDTGGVLLGGVSISFQKGGKGAPFFAATFTNPINEREKIC